MCNFNIRFLGVGRNKGVEGKDVAIVGVIEDPTSSGKATAFGVKKKEVV